MGDQATDAFAPLLASMPHLTQLDITGTAISSSQALDALVDLRFERGLKVVTTQHPDVMQWMNQTPLSTSLVVRAGSGELSWYDMHVVGRMVHELRELSLSGTALGGAVFERLWSTHQKHGSKALALESLKAAGACV